MPKSKVIRRKVRQPSQKQKVPTSFQDHLGNPVPSGKAREIIKQGGTIRPRKPTKKR